ncbi:MAG: sugar ABC transporter permease [Herpetosiphon sp.]
MPNAPGYSNQVATKARQNRQLRADITGWALVSPWIIGFLVFTLGPIVASLVISFTDWNLLSPPHFVGMANYRQMLFHDRLVWKSLGVTVTYSIVSVPLHLLLGFLLALVLNRKLRGLTIWRTIYYLPTLVSGVAVALLWRWIFNPDFGILNSVLHFIPGIPRFDWLGNPNLVIGSLILMSLWSVGGSMIINLAGLQRIPTYLYEAARIDGASPFRQLVHITVPMMSPVLFFNLIVGLIASFQTFTSAYVMTGGGPNKASLFYMLYLYFKAFQDFEVGYASALAWCLFLLMLLLTLVVFLSARYWVYYDGEENGA